LRVLFGLVLLVLATASFAVVRPVHVEAAPSDLQLTSQSFNVAADGSLTATVAMPSTLTDADLTTALFAVTVYQRVEKREDLLPLTSGSLTSPADTVAISPVCCAGPQAGEFTIAIPLEVTEVLPSALRVPSAGLYPVTIAVQRDGKVLSKILTFINRLPAVAETVDTEPISVGIAIGTHTTIHLDSKATTSLDPSAVQEMTALADSLDALDANKFPATVRVAPAVLTGLQQLNQTLFTRLIGSLQLHQVVAEPQWPIDPSAAAAAGQDSLYTSWLRDGQDRLVELGLGPAIISRSTIFADQLISGDGAALRRNLGAGLMVMSQDVYDKLDGNIGAYLDNTGELVGADLPNNTTFDVAVVDHTIAKLLAHPMPTIEQTRIYIVAQLLALRQAIDTSGASLQRHAVVIATPDLGVPDAALLGPVTQLIAATPGLAPATFDDIALRTDRLLIDGEEHPVTLPSIGGAELQKRVFKQAVLNNDIASVASMLPDGNERPKDWRELSTLLPTAALDDAAADSMITTVESQIGEVKSAVQLPTAYTVNLAGRRSTVRVRFVNNFDVPLKVKVQLTSPSGKLVFANDPLPVELPPGVPFNVEIEVEARSNGTSGVSLDVATPNDVKLGDTVPLKFRVNALGVGNVITAALFGLVLLWWLEHARSTWRKRRQRSPATLPAS
jgi:hypothetical protein